VPFLESFLRSNSLTTTYQVRTKRVKQMRTFCMLTNRSRWVAKQPRLHRMYVKTLVKTFEMPGVRPSSF